MSFLMKCPKCSNMIAKGTTCPNCRYFAAPEGSEDASGKDETHFAEYARRRAAHTVNYVLFMGLALVTGLLSAYTATLWFRVIFFGQLVALESLVMTGLAAIFTGFTVLARIFFSHHLFCPSCNIRLDEVGLSDGHCPGCTSRME